MPKDGRVHRNVSLNSLDPPPVHLNSSAVPTYAYFQLPYSRRSVSDLDFSYDAMREFLYSSSSSRCLSKRVSTPQKQLVTLHNQSVTWYLDYNMLILDSCFWVALSGMIMRNNAKIQDYSQSCWGLKGYVHRNSITEHVFFLHSTRHDLSWILRFRLW